MVPGVSAPWDQNDVIADGWLVGFILAMACRIYPRLVSDPCTSPQLSKVSSRLSERVPPLSVVEKVGRSKCW